MKPFRLLTVLLFASWLTSPLAAQDAQVVPAAAGVQTPPAGPTTTAPAARTAQPTPSPSTAVPRAGASAQIPEPSGPPVSSASSDVDEIRVFRNAVRVGSSYSLAQGADVSDVAVVMGDVAIDGHVHGDLAVVLGDLRLGPQAVVDGDIAVVGGSATAADGAATHGEFVIVGGTLDAPTGFLPEGEHVIVGTPNVAAVLRAFTPWLTRGLLWGRVIVPGLGWLWWLIGLSALLYLATAVLFPGAVATVLDTIATRPLSAFFAGLLTLLLVGPVSTILAISVVGIIVIPFLFFAVVIGGLVGKAAVFTWVGRSVLPATEEESRARAVVAIVIGLVFVTVLYMVPVVGLMTWAVTGLLGLGAASLTFFKAMRRERPAASLPPVPSPPAEPLPGMSAASVPSEHAEAAGGTALAFGAADSASMGAGAGASPAAAARPAAAASVAGDLSVYPRATFLDRLGAGVLDAVLVAVTIRLLGFRGPFDNFLLMLLIYHIAFWTWKGTTVGGIVTSLRVIRTDGAALRPVDAVVRGLASLLSLVALGIGFFWILLGSNRERQAWHDMIAGTFVVRVPRDLPLP